jgi:hypothetical protein
VKKHSQGLRRREAKASEPLLRKNFEKAVRPYQFANCIDSGKGKDFAMSGKIVAELIVASDDSDSCRPHRFIAFNSNRK